MKSFINIQTFAQQSINQSRNKTTQNNNISTVKSYLQKLKYNVSNDLKRHQLELMRSKKLHASKSEYLEQIKKLKHRQAVAKLWSGNHRLNETE